MCHEVDGEHHLLPEGERKQQHGWHEIVWRMESITYILVVSGGSAMVSIRLCVKSEVSLTS